ncbi:MAG: ATP-binding protein [Armatimonadetes bacterium]|nr:ATP-binding protein [Armatimonadota bacterium]
MTTYTSRSRITRFSLPAEPSAASVLRRFIREIARGTRLTVIEVTDLQLAVTEAYNNALTQQKHPNEGRIALKIDARPDEIIVDLAYRETHFPPAEFFSRC